LNYKALMLRVAGSVHKLILGTPRVGEHIRTTSVTEDRTESFNYRQLNATFIKLAIYLGFRSRRTVYTDHRLERRADRRALSCFRLVGGRARRPARACGDLDYDIRARGRHRTSDLVGTRPDRWFEIAL